jgi:hypothetical protein
MQAASLSLLFALSFNGIFIFSRKCDLHVSVVSNFRTHIPFPALLIAETISSLIYTIPKLLGIYNRFRNNASLHFSMLSHLSAELKYLNAYLLPKN